VDIAEKEVVGEGGSGSEGFKWEVVEEELMVLFIVSTSTDCQRL
jgi:hypothetical protein